MTGSVSTMFDLARARQRRLEQRLADSPYDAVLSLSPAAVDYATGYRSVSAAVHGVAGMAALTSASGTSTAGPVADVRRLCSGRTGERERPRDDGGNRQRNQQGCQDRACPMPGSITPSEPQHRHPRP